MAKDFMGGMKLNCGGYGNGGGTLLSLMHVEEATIRSQLLFAFGIADFIAVGFEEAIVLRAFREDEFLSAITSLFLRHPLLPRRGRRGGGLGRWSGR
jgi:hypothetical protein